MAQNVSVNQAEKNAKQKGETSHGNLVPVTNRTKDEARELSKKGGIASGESRRRKKLLKETAQALLASEIDLSKLTSKARKRFQSLPMTTRDTINLQTAAILGQIAGMIDGDARCAKYVTDLIDENNQDEQETSKLDFIAAALKEALKEP